MRINKYILMVAVLWTPITACDSVDDGNGTDTPALDSESENSGDAGDPADTGTGAGDSSDLGEPTATYTGFEEFYILTDSDDPTDVCRVRYEITAVGAPSAPCELCDWTVVVEKQNPSVVVDVDGACANSSLGLDEATIASHVGERVGYGYIYEYVGHSNVLMGLDEATGEWGAITYSNWSEDTGEFFYDQRDGYCEYGTSSDPEATNTGICGFAGEAVVLPL